MDAFVDRESDRQYYADVLPYHLLSDASVAALNERLEENGVNMEVEQSRFRPNIYVSGVSKAFAEDEWTHIRIGDGGPDSSVFRVSKLCPRCVFVLIDPETGEKDRRQEPLKTLRTFRYDLIPS